MAALNFRLPDSLKERVRTLAEKEGISMNQYILLAVAEKTAVKEDRETTDELSSQYLEARAARARRRASEAGLTVQEHFMQLLDKARDEEPPPDDRLPEGMSSSGAA